MGQKSPEICLKSEIKLDFEISYALERRVGPLAFPLTPASNQDISSAARITFEPTLAPRDLTRRERCTCVVWSLISTRLEFNCHEATSEPLYRGTITSYQDTVYCSTLGSDIVHQYNTITCKWSILPTCPVASICSGYNTGKTSSSGRPSVH